jgi:hypothetical protein
LLAIWAQGAFVFKTLNTTGDCGLDADKMMQRDGGGRHGSAAQGL